MDKAIHTVEYRIRDLTTRSVTLLPSSAQITRELNDVQLKPGINEIVVVGLSPTVDQHSIKVEGSGKAVTFTDVSVELLPNRELWQDVYPDSDDEDEPTKENDDEGEEEREKIKKSMEAKNQQLTLLGDERDRTSEMVASAAAQAKFLDAFGQSLSDSECKISIKDGLQAYVEERRKVFNEHMEGVIRRRQIEKQIADITTELADLQAKLHEKKKKSPQEIKRDEKERLRKVEAKKEKERIRKQREQFWPRLCYTVRITLDASSAGVALSSLSRPSSVSSSSDLNSLLAAKESLASPNDDAARTCNLSLSYITTSAFWAPSYDLALSTTTNTAQLCFDALLTNMTCETWSNCKITLSNSQTMLSSLGDAIPTLKPWHIRLFGKHGRFGDNSELGFGDIMSSREERDQKKVWFSSQNIGTLRPRAQLFGVGPELSSENPPGAIFGQPNAFASTAFGAPPQPPAPSQAVAGGLFGSSKPRDGPMFGGQPGSSLFGAVAHEGASEPSIERNAGNALFGSSSHTDALTSQNMSSPRASASGNTSKNTITSLFGNIASKPVEDQQYRDSEEKTMIHEPPMEFSFQESTFEETGMTTTYDLPGHKTLQPGLTPSKQRVVGISYKDVVFSRTIVAKYKPAAYLEAKVCNNSKTTLLKGPANITLDNTFLGRDALPLCSIGESFSLSLGVDPTIKVSYPKPDVKRSTNGMFSRENSCAHTRTVTIVNNRAKPAEPIRLRVLDQVPVSEDERLRVSTLHPRGLSVDGAAVQTGESGHEGQKDWGRATAVLKKNGEVSWDVVLNAGRSTKLTLEYEVSLPMGEHAMQC